MPKKVINPVQAAENLERYSENDKEFFRNLLNEKRTKVKEELEFLNEVNKSSSHDGVGENTSYGQHSADQGTDSGEREKSYLLATREGRYLKYLERALVMIDTGDYGKCTDCGEMIQKRRLELVPTTRLCIKCKFKEESKRK